MSVLLAGLLLAFGWMVALSTICRIEALGGLAALFTGVSGE